MEPAKSRTIQLFLPTGNPAGPIKSTLANWTGVAYKIPRTDLDTCKDRKDLKHSGIYFLFGNDEQTGKQGVYVGQAGNRKNGEGLLNRLQEHRRSPDKEYWTEAMVFTTTDNSLGPTEITWLEHHFCQLAKNAGRYTVKNASEPAAGNVTEEKECELQEFAENAKLIMTALGQKVFQPKDDHPQDQPPPILYLTRKNRQTGFTAQAQGRQTSDGFVVLKGSRISPEDDHTVTAGIRRRRAQASIDNDHILQEDELFDSPSAAAVFVTGKSTNGRESWKTAEGLSLARLESNDSE